MIYQDIWNFGQKNDFHLKIIFFVVAIFKLNPQINCRKCNATILSKISIKKVKILRVKAGDVSIFQVFHH